ncbi:MULTISPECIES: ABC-F family ATP-binding cassette domain-containing protein [Thermomonosporaceae]|uniref:ABC-F family ATP-binding cassette domain-containing protein n=1 Tax=Thermomonosporaceae TaxID=2012 RepID=UPI00255B1662|nr:MULTISPECIES: ATP-binding cassette domain-containing protein [Thermomonosporaceae]MDL4772636.1 ATP-binding cassette domain-containing protein [Actinomadura xylanilytica]
MGHVEAGHVSHTLPDGRVLLDDVSFRVGEGVTAALVGPNGAGKTTLLRLVAGDLTPQDGTVAHSGGLGVMRQFVGNVRDASSVHDLLLTTAAPQVREAAAVLDAAELAMMERDDEPAQMRYANALTGWGDAGGYDAEVLWDACCVAALGVPYDKCRYRDAGTLSGGEQKRLVLEALLRGPDEVLLLDEPDNYLDVPGKLWLEERLRETSKTVLLVSHDRELLDRAADRIVTVEAGRAWIHGGRFATYAEARQDRNERLEELRRRWDEEHAKLRQLVMMLKNKATFNDGLASRYQAAQTRLRKFEEAGPPEVPPRDQSIKMRLRGGRTGKRAVVCEGLELTGLMRPFDTEVWYGERVAVLGSNGSGKSHFLRLLAGVAETLPRGATPVEPVAHTGVGRLGARVVPGLFAQTHARPDLAGRTPCEIVMTEHARLQNAAMNALARYELQLCAEQPFETLSGGQQARLQILLLELGGATLLLLDEPTDNLDLASAEALQEGLEYYEGTVLAVTHDRWFARSFDRFLVFGADGSVYESPDPVWDETRVTRPR